MENTRDVNPVTTSDVEHATAGDEAVEEAVADVADLREGAADTHPASVLGKAHQILEAFATGPSTMGLTELSRRSHIPKASAHRLAVELVGLGLLARTPKGYQLGWRIFELGQLVPGPASLRAIARPALVDLHLATRAVVHLAVPQGGDCVYLERFAGRREMPLLAAVGARMPKHATASGRLFLAYQDEPAPGTELLAAFGAPDTATLAGVFEAIRDRRSCSENQECVSGFKSTAVPVFYPGTTHVLAAISATTTADRRDDQQVTHALWAAANDIMRGLGLTASGRSRSRLVG
jgi:DNA-binding IclR family transcriptional regulator